MSVFVACALFWGCGQTGVEPVGFVRASFDVPDRLETELFCLRPIKESYAPLDYDAVMASAEHLRKRFGDGWPPEDFSVAKNQQEIALHVSQFEQRRSFTYSVFDSTESRIIGCVYIVPDETDSANARVIYWIRTDEFDASFERQLKNSLSDWLEQAWEFPAVTFDNN